MSKSRKAAAPAAAEQERPRTGGSFVRDRASGKLTQVEGLGVAPAAPVAVPLAPEPETSAPAEPAGDSAEEA